MIIYVHNQHAAPLLHLLRELKTSNAQEQDAAKAACSSIVHEMQRAPYTLWQREQPTTQPAAPKTKKRKRA